MFDSNTEETATPHVFIEMTLFDRHDLAVAHFGNVWFQTLDDSFGEARFLTLRRDDWDSLGQPDTIRVTVKR